MMHPLPAKAMPESSTAAPAVPAENKGLISLMVALLAACVAFQLNASMLSPVLVVMAADLNTSEVTVGLSQTAFFTSTALFGLFLPRLSDIVGRRKILVLMVGVMVLGSVLAAMAPNITVLIIARMIQGISGAIVPVCLMVLRTKVKDAKQYGTLMGVVTAVNGGIAGVDAFAGGFLASAFGFRSIFWVIAAAGVIAVVLVTRYVPDSKPSQGVGMDWWGVLALAVTILFLQTAVNELGKGTASNGMLVLSLLAGGIVSAVVFWKIEGAVRQPLATPALMKKRSTWAMLLTTTLTMTGVFATVNGVVMSLAQNPDAGFGLKADMASLILLTPYALLGWIMGPFAGRLASTLGYLTILRIGLGGSALGIVALALAGTQNLTFLIGGTLFLGITYAGMANIMLNGLGVVLSPADNPGFLPGMNAASFGLGAGLSFAIMPALQANAGSGPAGYVVALLVGAGITVAALLMSLLIPRPTEAGVEVARK